MINYSDMYKSEDSDVFICERPLDGEGLWCHYYQYLSRDGFEYQVWVDQDGSEKVVELK